MSQTTSQMRKNLHKEYVAGLISHKEYLISLNTIKFLEKMNRL